MNQRTNARVTCNTRVKGGNRLQCTLTALHTCPGEMHLRGAPPLQQDHKPADTMAGIPKTGHDNASTTTGRALSCPRQQVPCKLQLATQAMVPRVTMTPLTQNTYTHICWYIGVPSQNGVEGCTLNLTASTAITTTPAVIQFARPATFEFGSQQPPRTK